MASWKIIWLSASREEAVKQSLLVPQQLGLVKSRDKYGLRVPADAFGEAFKKLRPAALPVQVHVRELYKLGPLLMGATSASVQTWIVAIQWEAKVLKSLGPSHMIGAATSPASAVPCLNGSPVLLSRVQNRKNDPPGVDCRKRKPLRMRRRSTHGRSRTPGQSTVLQKETGPASASSTTGSSGATTLSRLHALETNLAAMQALQGQERQERLEDRAHVAQEFKVQTLNSGLAAQLQASLDSLRSAQQSQERQMAQGMDELKALIVSSHAKKQRTDHDDL